MKVIKIGSKKQLKFMFQRGFIFIMDDESIENKIFMGVKLMSKDPRRIDVAQYDFSAVLGRSGGLSNK